VADIAFETDLTVETLQTGALTTTNADITANGTYAGGVIETAGTLAADSEQGRVTTSGDITLQNGEWTVSNIEGALGDLSTTGNLSGIGGDIAAIRGDLVLSGTSPLIPAESVEANIRLGDARVDVDALLEGLTVWRIQDATVQVTAVGPRDAVDFTVGMEGKTQVRDVTRDLSMTATGTADLRQESLSAQTGFDMTMGRLELAGEAQATRQDEGWAGSLDAQGLGGAMALSLTPGADGAVEFDLDSLSVPQLAALLARPATEGSVSGQGRFAVVGESVEGDAMLTLADLRSPISDADAVTIQTEINLADERLRIATQATEGGLEGSARLVGPVETLPRAPYIVFPPAVPLQGRADLSGEIGPVAEIFLPPLTDVAGRIESDLRFTVPHTPAALKGRVEVTDGVFEQGSVGLRLREMSLLAELDGEIITVPRLSARGADGGSLEGSGRMGLGDATGTVNVRAEKLRVVDRREGHAEVSGELDISRTTELLKLGGELQVTDAEINIARLPEPGLPTLEIDFGEETEEEEPKGFAATATEMDIRITSNGRIEVTGRGLDALMSLDASVVGPFNDPVITGDMSVDRGRFDFLSKRFEFRDSSVTIRDDIMQSALNFEAIRRTPDLTAVVSISGTLDRPEIDLRSEPNLPEDEVLARILFGRSPTQLSAIEAARLAAALAQLSGGSGFDLFGSLENAIGLDTLDIGRNDTGQTQLTTGKYLSDNVYLEVRTAAEGTPGIAVEWQVRDNITVEGETVPNERERLSVQWKKDFD
jgi:autotransporter translocation and assembly factor TamB